MLEPWSWRAGQFPTAYVVRFTESTPMSVARPHSAAVREERLRLIEETLIKYGSVIGGLELVLNYVPYYFHPSEVAEGRQIMTEFIAHVSKLVANR